MTIGLPELIIVLVIAVILLVPLVVSIRARPLGEYPYRWATLIACQSAATALATLLNAIAMALVGGFIEAAVSSLLGVGLLTASVGLFQRRKYGAVLAIGSQSVLLAMALITARPSGTSFGPHQDALPSVALLAVFVVINGIYFKKRWAALSQRRRLEPKAEPMPA